MASDAEDVSVISNYALLLQVCMLVCLVCEYGRVHMCNDIFLAPNYILWLQCLSIGSCLHFFMYTCMYVYVLYRYILYTFSSVKGLAWTDSKAIQSKITNTTDK